ncbi:two-component sensor histidine kinase [Streptomyces sp. SID13666]|uniref:sensor histidine kinase n=1 Tax=Streptomyces TaxID=1883 RepID=UPI001106B20D|nr:MULTISPECIES: histidine kinase [Streptomyces]MCZ4099008.1 histidine kinase [Streptomyces sp. H39-C1]NEA58524.1 two-component sensor histidine kinase [Streptomyces sp. SID13666]NEA72488.1 two-component sensor histidine kinase [Streptomyces sp. SID13588]QNA74445.1 two-component sensor histidine kinase [Streptomyces sp. So13.3]
MIWGIRPLLRGSTYTGMFLAYCGALASIPLLPFAMLPTLVWPSAPYGVKAVLTLLVWAALIGTIGLARTTRRALIAFVRRLLGVPLPDPAASGGDRWRTPLWLLLHVTLGWTGALVSGVLLIMGVSLPFGWLRGEAELSLFGWSLRAEGGRQNWTRGLCCLLLAAVVCVVVTGALRRLAPRLLGPSAAERLALAAEREQALAERNRLAHELHDSIGHTLTATTIQAAVASQVLATDPATARAALRSIEESSRAALEDLDYVLGVLRDQRAETAPTRTLANLPELVDRLRHAGATVEPELSGDWAQVQGTLSRAAYRILQEGLTNALRHGAGGPIELRVAATPDSLELGVVNRTGPGTGAGPFPTSGHGMPGLAERVRLLHGEIEAGPQGTRHWRLVVRLPIPASA